jgi:hypothetical protein
MQLKYLFIPTNHNLQHCVASYNSAFKSSKDGNSQIVEHIASKDYRVLADLFKKIINSDPTATRSIFLFSPQREYLIIIPLLRFISKVTSKKLIIYYLMHEPRYERGRAGVITTNSIYFYHLLMGYLSDRILIPSDRALVKAKTFVDASKLDRVNLAFMSIADRILQKNLAQLSNTWDECKTFSLLGTAAQDKNPQGFILFASIINKEYPEQARFIRAGRDLDVKVDYDRESIVRFPGYMLDGAKSFLFGLTHFIVIPYLFSTQSGVIAEALSYGKLLIVNDIPAFANLKGLNFVFIVDFNNENSILNCLNDLFKMDWIEYERRYWSAVNYFQNNFSETHLAKVIDDIMSKADKTT